MTWTDRFLMLFVLIGVPLLLIAFPLYLLFGGLRTFALRPLQRCFEGIRLKQVAEGADVQVVYHTYRGFLLWFTQDEHLVITTVDDAHQLLGRLLRFNLTWGMLSGGMLFIPLLAIGNYYAQLRSIRRQIAQQGDHG